MCGIFGAFCPQGHSLPDPHSVINTLSHRGPDGDGFYQSPDQRVLLVHTRLAIQDVSPSGSQPMQSQSGNYILTFNGEIYNFKELREDLLADGYTFTGLSDTEVLLQFCIRSIQRGEFFADALKKLNGIFSFALYDNFAKKIYLVRDGFGVKPLYYGFLDNCFYFSSELKVFKDLSLDFGGLVHHSIYQYCSHLWNPGVSLPTSSFNKLCPGHLIIVDSDISFRSERWYIPPLASKSRRVPEQSLISSTLDHLQKAVSRQMVSDVQVGAFLSGGLDSSSIVAFARNINPDIPCFTINTSSFASESGSSDLDYAKLVSKHLSVPLTVVDVNPFDYINKLPSIIYQLDEPLADPAAFNTFLLCDVARKEGVRVLLSGLGGDDIFTGYRRHTSTYLDSFLQYIPSNIRSFVSTSSSFIRSTNPTLRRLQKFLRGFGLSGDQRIFSYFNWIDPAILSSLFSDHFLDNQPFQGFSEHSSLLNHLHSLPSDTSPLTKILSLEQNFFLPDHNLTYTDKMSMSCGVEVRVPFLDQDLVDFVSRIPMNYKQRSLQGKWILKKSLENYLPRSVIYRSKQGFGSPLRSWFRNELKDWLYDILSTSNLSKRQIFDPSSVHSLIEANSSGRIDASYVLLSLVCIELWFQIFIDNASPLYSDLTSK